MPVGEVIVLGAGAGALWWWRKRNPRVPAARTDVADAVEGFQPVAVDRMCGNRWGIALDAENARFAVAREGRRRIYNCEQLIRVEACVNGVPVAQGGGAGGDVMGAAILGDLVAGPIGAMAGAAMAASRVKSLSLRLLTDDLAQPWLDVMFLDERTGLSPRHKRVRYALAQWKNWEGRLLTVVARQPQLARPFREDRALVG